MNEKQLRNLAWHQMHLLIKKGEYVAELKEIWHKTWLMEYPYYTDSTGKIYHIGG